MHDSVDGQSMHIYINLLCTHSANNERYPGNPLVRVKFAPLRPRARGEVMVHSSGLVHVRGLPIIVGIGRRTVTKESILSLG